MKGTINQRTLMVILSVLLIAGQLPHSSISPQSVVTDRQCFALTQDYNHIASIDYQWQEINGFCHWAASTMMLRSAGVDIDLHRLFAISGIGFSAAYVRYEGDMAILSGAIYKQMVPLSFVSEIYGLNYSILIDTSYDFGELYAQGMGIWGLNYTVFDGSEDALTLVRSSIDEGYPLLIWADPYYLPAKDYDINRELGITSDISGSGHAVVVVGYNDTSQTAWIADPGVGSFGEYFGYPADGRWYYNISYTNLSLAWSSMSYGTVLIRPQFDSVSDMESRLMDFICDRLEGDRTSYAPSQEDLFFLSFGADAFRALSLDLNLQGLSLLLEDIGSHEGRVAALWGLGFMTEFTGTLQYLSFRAALHELPDLFPDLDLTDALSKGMESLPHLAALSNNATIASTDPEDFGGSLVWDTLTGLSTAYDIQRDLETAMAPYLENMTVIVDHLEAIAESWDSLAAELRQVFSSGPLEPTILLVVGSSAALCIVAVVVMRRRR